jgi:GNAT superfamily N-acetyltransferase
MIEKYLEDKYESELLGLDIYEDGKSIKLYRIIVNPDYRNSGVGSSIMNDLVEYGDKTKKIITLTPSSAFGGNKNKLVQFYKKFGFKMNKGIHKSYEYMDTMIRWPRLNEGDLNTKSLIKKLLRESILKQN